MDINNNSENAKKIYLEILKRKSVKEALDQVNPIIYQWCKNALNCEIPRTVQICTFMINFFILKSYFPGVGEVSRYKNPNKPKNDDIDDPESGMLYQALYGLMIYLNIIYKYDEKWSRGRTDQQINELMKSKPIFSQFFVFNIYDPDLKVGDISTLNETYTAIEPLLPDLEFDPEFAKVLNSPPIKHMFDIEHIHNIIDKGPSEIYEPYWLSEALHREFNMIKDETLFSINKELEISIYLKKKYNYVGMFLLYPEILIKDLVRVLTEYYCLRSPSNRQKIQAYITCFGELLKICKGKSIIDISWNEMRTILQSKVNSSFVNKFMEEMILERQQLEFPPEMEFNGKKMLFEYQLFLRKAGYYIGRIHTGALLVWRSLIKYLEQIQKSDEFRNLKGKLLENWCYNEAEKRGFQPEKLILKNSNRDLSRNPKYNKLKSQISDFPKKPLKLKVDAPNNLNFDFREFDVIFRVGDYLFLLECKATSVPIGEFGEYGKWIEYSNERLEIQDQKEKILKYLINNNIIQHQLFDNIKEYFSIQIQTEGLIHAYSSVTCKSYIKILDDLKNAVQEKRVNEFFMSFKKSISQKRKL